MTRQIVSSIMILFVAFVIGYDILTMDARELEHNRYDNNIDYGMDLFVEFDGSVMKVSADGENNERLVFGPKVSSYQKFWRMRLFETDKIIGTETFINQELVIEHRDDNETEQSLLSWLEEQEDVIILNKDGILVKEEQIRGHLFSLLVSSDDIDN
ncbi:hypothetical protein AJ85_16125 [Alkalihalobacillus alcalophilus ATCC 27647 = CGMCC 1.3604]|uniref:Uncharacterized protein n=1 Tax=Alkalihalobacillus alcalophilus ATCC 27647 = CGMCC 1.3604 TaxID=1218173 RepID=A0A094WJ43_ALKAL|nr:hypothetical protein [Alkalihalobacillus alcalophilus]KGA97789.1 hypothetical protein BALCAV_0208135 [Alkalihalobacillus alcalophilus ATCC 27647 = CGMCC 1.3604]MED1562051.1 hypothetical protein [Alkalihalobacillus alcalophilus]THG92202.1 hypothetical protein AJ85_16125 [Alkalihalobacillus alcalophilus ATCC 27647 = CGMCC 1.3604]